MNKSTIMTVYSATGRSYYPEGQIEIQRKRVAEAKRAYEEQRVDLLALYRNAMYRLKDALSRGQSDLEMMERENRKYEQWHKSRPICQHCGSHNVTLSAEPKRIRDYDLRTGKTGCLKEWYVVECLDCYSTSKTKKRIWLPEGGWQEQESS